MTPLRLSVLMALVMAMTGCDPRRKQDVPPLPEGFVAVSYTHLRAHET